MLHTARTRGYKDTFIKLSVNVTDMGTTPKKERILPWWTPLASAATLGLGTYALARHQFKGPAGSALARIRNAAKGEMLYGTSAITNPKGVSLTTGEPLTLWDKLLLPLKEGPLINTEKKDWVKNLKRKDSPVAVWDWDNPGVGNRTFNPAMGPPGKKLQAWGAREAPKLEDRLLEYNLLNKYAPGSQARSLVIGDVLKRHGISLREQHMSQDLRRLQTALEKEFPTGYLAKTKGDGLIDVNVNSAGFFPESGQDWVKQWKLWKKLRKPYMKDLEKAYAEKQDLGDIAYRYRDRPGYRGRVLEEMLHNNVMLQEKLPLAGEHRVQVIGGRVIPYLTHPRYPSDTAFGTVKDFLKGRGSAKWFQNDVLNKLPAKYRNLSYGADIAPLKGGGYKVIELNTGGASGYLDYDYMPNLLHKAVTGRFTRPVAGTLAAGAGTLGAGAGLGAYALSPKRTAIKVPEPEVSEMEEPISLANFR